MADTAVKQKRKKRGPKPKMKNGKRYTSYLPEEVYEYLCRIGGGVLSHGIRVTAMSHKDRYGDEITPELLLKVK